MSDAEKLAAIQREIVHATANGHHLSEDCQGVNLQNPPPAVRIDRLMEILNQ